MAPQSTSGCPEEHKTTGTIGQTAGEMASAVGQKAQESASSAAQMAKDMASDMGQKAEHATAAMGGRIRSFAGTLRETLPHEGMLGSASSAVADTLESSGRYLEQEGLSGVAEDLTNIIRRNPIPALLVGIGIGYLIARSLRR